MDEDQFDVVRTDIPVGELIQVMDWYREQEEEAPARTRQIKEDAKAYAIEMTSCSAEEADQAFELPEDVNEANPDETQRAVFEYVKAVKDAHLQY